MIDIHILIHPTANLQWLHEIVCQLDQEEGVNIFPIHNQLSIAEGRMEGYQLGSAPFVGFVDCDDLIEPGIFGKILAAFRDGAEVVSCNEQLMSEDGTRFTPGVLMMPSLYPPWVQSLFPYKDINHHIFCFRRELLNPDYVADSAMVLAETALALGDCTYAAVKDIGSRKAVLIPEVGYYYRRHKGQVTAWMEEHK